MSARVYLTSGMVVHDIGEMHQNMMADREKCRIALVLEKSCKPELPPGTYHNCRIVRENPGGSFDITWEEYTP